MNVRLTQAINIINAFVDYARHWLEHTNLVDLSIQIAFGLAAVAVVYLGLLKGLKLLGDRLAGHPGATGVFLSRTGIRV